jgi:hypothetical protein
MQNSCAAIIDNYVKRSYIPRANVYEFIDI